MLSLFPNLEKLFLEFNFSTRVPACDVLLSNIQSHIPMTTATQFLSDEEDAHLFLTSNPSLKYLSLTETNNEDTINSIAHGGGWRSDKTPTLGSILNRCYLGCVCNTST
jgi:hypothetical protein